MCTITVTEVPLFWLYAVPYVCSHRVFKASFLNSKLAFLGAVPGIVKYVPFVNINHCYENNGNFILALDCFA